MPSWLYILRLKSGSLYVGATTNLKKRYVDHCSGKACRTTKFDPPVDIVYAESFEELSGARNRELQVKRWSRAKKQALISGDIAKLKELAKLHKK
jgi:putative endonuclease